MNKKHKHRWKYSKALPKDPVDTLRECRCGAYEIAAICHMGLAGEDQIPIPLWIYHKEPKK